MSIASKLAGVAAAAALAGSVSPAHGQDGHDAWFYIGAAAGHVEYSQAERYYAPFRTYPWSDEVTIDLVAESGVDLDSSTRSERFHAGYRANRHLALELGYADLGTSEHVTFCPGTLSEDPINCLFDAYGPSRSTTQRADFTVQAIRPIGERFEVMAKLGIARTRHETLFLVANPHTDTEYFTGRIIGAGVRFFITPSWALRLDYDRSEVPAVMVNHHPADKRIDAFWLCLEYGLR